MALSVFDLFSIGIGPSSSHTVGPMRAAHMFIEHLGSELPNVTKVTCHLHGSLGATGIGHGTDRAVILGLLGCIPETVDPREGDAFIADVAVTGRLNLAGYHMIPFSPSEDIILDGLNELPGHPNGMRLVAYNDEAVIADHIYYSVGGGFVVCGDVDPDQPVVNDVDEVPYPYNTAAELMAHCSAHNMTIAEVALANELSMRTAAEIDEKITAVWDVMQECVNNGARNEGRLPGSLRVLRRAPALHRKLIAENACADPLRALDWITFYALAVNEENAAGGRMVTAPTNGAAGIIPAVLHYYRDFVADYSLEGVKTFLLTAAAIGMIFKNTASISGAEVGCQGEVGSACSMAAAGCAAVMGGTPSQVENAAEIAMEHNLGLTCDPIGGLVQVPCIERNAIAAVKAVTASRTALVGDGSHIVSLDDVIVTMRETGRDMQVKYKETALGGLAVHVGVPVNVVEC